MFERMKRLGLAALLALAESAAQAAGGHHDVDDANILARGECSQETWLVSAGGGQRRLHAGVNCRVGPVELGLAGEHQRESDPPSQNFWAPEVKWAREVAEGFSVGFDLQPIFQANARKHYVGFSAYAIATWSPRPDLSFHANFGRDFERGDAGQPRGGVAVEWQATPRWSFVAERFREQATHYLRGGVRWVGGHSWSVDLSHARSLAGPNPSRWTIGLNLDIDDD